MKYYTNGRLLINQEQYESEWEGQGLQFQQHESKEAALEAMKEKYGQEPSITDMEDEE